MRAIQPLKIGAIGGLSLVSSSVPENDFSDWVASQSVPLGYPCIFGHRIYESLQAGVCPATDPSVTPLWWLDAGPTNRWAMFDTSASSATIAPGSISVTLAAGPFNSLALVGVIGSTVTIVTTGSAGTIRQAIIPAPVAPSRTSSVVIDGLGYAGDGAVQIEITGSGVVQVGSITLGTTADLGETEMGLRIEIVDYSRKTADSFGALTVTKRGYSRRLVAAVTVPRADVDRVVSALQYLRSTPCLWTAAEDLRSATVFGYFTDWQVTIATPTQSTYSITIESLALNDLRLMPGQTTPPPPTTSTARILESGTFRYFEDGTIRLQEA